MSLIFDRFPSKAKARAFVKAVFEQFELEGQIFQDQESAMEHDPFPWSLDPPIVLIDRPSIDLPNSIEIELQIEELAQNEFGATFAGT